MISAVVLTRNGEEKIQKFLKTLNWCDEVVVITNEHIEDYAAQRNFGLSNARHDWVLFVDDDEIVSIELAQEIKEAVKTSNYDGYYLSRRDLFFGKWLLHGETANVQILRLGRKNQGKWRRKVHEFWHIEGKVGRIRSPLKHYPHQSISDFIKSINQYTTIDARELQKEGKQFSVWRIIINPLAKFCQNYFWRLGFLDGLAGLVMAFMMSFYSLVVRIKQYDFSRNS